MMLKILNILFPVITTPYLTRLLSPEIYSEFNSANTYVSLFIPIAAFGIYNYGIRELSNIKTNENKLNEVFSKLFYSGLITATITFTIYLTFIMNNGKFSQELYYVIGFQILFQFLYVEWVNEALENYQFILYKTLFVRLLMLISIFLFVREKNDILPYTYIMTVFTILNFIISFIWIFKDVKLVAVKLSSIFNLIYRLFPVFLLANVNMLYTILDRVFLTYSTINTHITYYTLAQTITIVITGVVYGAFIVNVPRYGYYLGLNNKKKYEDLLNLGSSYFLFFIIPISFGLIILGKDIMFISFGENYYNSLILSVFGIRTIFWAIESILGHHIIFTNGFEKVLTFYYFIGGIINATLNILLYILGYMTPVTILLTTILAEIIVVLMELIFIKRNNIVNLKFIFSKFYKYTLTSLSFILVWYTVNEWLFRSYKWDVQYIVYLIVVVSMCSIIYILILYIFKDSVIKSIILFIKKRYFKI